MEWPEWQNVEGNQRSVILLKNNNFNPSPHLSSLLDLDLDLLDVLDLDLRDVLDRDLLEVFDFDLLDVLDLDLDRFRLASLSACLFSLSSFLFASSASCFILFSSWKNDILIDWLIEWLVDWLIDSIVFCQLKLSFYFYELRVYKEHVDFGEAEVYKKRGPDSNNNEEIRG